MSDKLFIPVILGTLRKGNKSEAAAKLVHEEAQKNEEITTELIDIKDLGLKWEDEGEQAKIPEFSEKMKKADGLILIVPEYNHSFPGSLKYVLDTNLKEYIHKAVGVCGVSSGPFGGARMIQSFTPVARELGLTMTFSNVNFSSVGKIFDDQGKLLDDAFIRRIAGFLDELIWMSKTLKHGRENWPSKFETE